MSMMKKVLIFLLTTVFLTLQGCSSGGSGKISTMKETTVYASKYGAAMNSDVYAGGGTDDTDILQAILDQAPRLGRLHLIIDGAALTSRMLKVHSNTTIECPNKSCGLFLADSSNCSLIGNADFDMETIRNHNITLLGGVYNNNSPGQLHHREEETWNIISNMVMGMEFYGVENVIMRDITIANQRTWAMIMANWKYVTIENMHIDRRERADDQNQDGLHFFGPGRFLTIRDIRGNAGDDFIALAPDEHDAKSSIEDVLIQGVHFEDVDQGIRMLVHGEGKLDRVIVRDVTGTYRSYAFFITPWNRGEGGHYGNIVFDMIDVRPMKNNYTYHPPFLFKLAGNIESIVCKNIYNHTPDYNHQLFVIGGHYVYDERPDRPATAQHPTHIGKLVVDGLYIDERNENGVPDSYFRIKNDIDMLSISNVILQRAPELPVKSSLIRVESGTVGEVRMNNVSVSGLNTLIDVKGGTVKSRKIYNVN